MTAPRLAVLSLLVLPGFALAGPDPDEVRASLKRGVAFLKTTQNPDGSFAPRFAGPGITSLAAIAMMRAGYGPDDPAVAKAMGYLERNVKPDGGIYAKGLANYTTCLGLQAFMMANRDGKYDTIIANAVKFIKSMQNTDDPEDPLYGGAGYDGSGGADLSNTQYLIEALHEAGVSQDDPAMQRAIGFLSRCQNLPGELNKLPYAEAVTEDDKGGFVYDPTGAEDEDNPKRTPRGGLRSEGGMTYAGLKSFLYAGVSKDDPRVKAAINWIKRHCTLDENPGMGQSGLFYYYHTFAKAMDALGEDTFTDADGKDHDWRAELFAELKGRQRDDGSWANKDRAYLENLPELSTSFAILAMSYTLPEKN